MKAQIALHLVNDEPIQFDPAGIEFRKSSDDRDNPTFVKLRGGRGMKVKETMEEIDELFRRAG